MGEKNKRGGTRLVIKFNWLSSLTGAKFNDFTCLVKLLILTSFTVFDIANNKSYIVDFDKKSQINNVLEIFALLAFMQKKLSRKQNRLYGI